MKAESLERPKESTSFDKHAMSATHRKTLEAIFRHPSAHNLEWHAVVALIEKIGEVTHKPSDQWTFRVS